jgi:hypothetical protein
MIGPYIECKEFWGSTKTSTALTSLFFKEGPRSRSYGRTAALRLIVQPCAEDEVKDDGFFYFSK